MESRRTSSCRRSGSDWAATVGKSRDDFVDLAVSGKDAARAFASFVAKFGARRLYDVDRAHVSRIAADFRKHAKRENLDATVGIAPERIGHGARIRRLKETGLMVAEFSFALVNVVVLFGLPRDRELRVVARRDVDDGAWDYVSLVCNDTPTKSKEEVARLSVEEARFLFADAEALAAWDHHRSIDGLRDLVFWGEAEETMVQTTGAERPYPASDYLGWVNLPPGACPPHFVQRILAAAEKGELFLELRPHSTHHAVLLGAWNSPHEAGTATIGGAKMCGLFTSVGDGTFPLLLERDAEGQVCRVTVAIGAASTCGEDDDDDEASDDA
jgi:hypothetical protein